MAIIFHSHFCSNNINLHTSVVIFVVTDIYLVFVRERKAEKIPGVGFCIVLRVVTAVQFG